MTLLSTIRDLHRRKGRERRGLALAEGVRLVEEMLVAGVHCKGAFISPALAATERGIKLRQALLARVAPIESVPDDELIALAATEQPQGVVAVYQTRKWPIEHFVPASGRPLVVLDGVQDPGNVGTIARTAAAFNAAGLVALPGTADLTNPKVVRGAMGALFHLPHCLADDAALFGLVERHRVALWATAIDGDPVQAPPPGESLALIFGNEGAGVRAELLAAARRRIGIPIQPGAESLNVAVAAGIILYQVTR